MVWGGGGEACPRTPKVMAQVQFKMGHSAVSYPLYYTLLGLAIKSFFRPLRSASFLIKNNLCMRSGNAWHICECPKECPRARL